MGAGEAATGIVSQCRMGRDDGSSDRGGGQGGSGADIACPDPLRANKGACDGLDVGCERKRGSTDAPKVFVQDKWKDGVSIKRAGGVHVL